jgi:hypothetical protein
MNDYQITFQLDGTEQTIELTAETAKQVEALLPKDAEIVRVKFLRSRGFSCHVRGSTLRRQ